LLENGAQVERGRFRKNVADLGRLAMMSAPESLPDRMTFPVHELPTAATASLEAQRCKSNQPAEMPPKFNVNSRVGFETSCRVFLFGELLIPEQTIVAPLAAFTMAGLLFVYTRTSIQAAKRNAQKHREADGGQINWNNENLRRHGKLEPPVEQGPIKQLVGLAKEKVGGEGHTETEQERAIKERVGKGKSS
jgi:hypothetical protein